MDETDIHQAPPPPAPTDTNAATAQPPLVLTYELLQRIYSSLYELSFDESLSEYSTTAAPRSLAHLHIPIVHLLDLFLHSANPTYSGPYPQFTFSEKNIAKLQKGLPLKFPGVNHFNLTPTANTTTTTTNSQAAPNSLTGGTANQLGSADDILVPPTFDIDHSDYLARFLTTLGDPTAFATHLRSTFLLSQASRSLLASTNFYPSSNDVQQLTITLTHLLQHLLIQFSAICDHYDIAAAGSLDIASALSAFFRVHSLPNVNVTLFSLADSPVASAADLREFFNDNEIAFITAVLPEAFTKSPLNPRAAGPADEPTGTGIEAHGLPSPATKDSSVVADGIILPLSFSTPEQAQSFTQHYTQLLPANAPQHAKVPLSNIPFSIIVYVGLLQHVMLESWRALSNLNVAGQEQVFACWNHGLRELLPLYLAAVPSLPSNIFDQILQCVSNLLHEGPPAIGSLLAQVPLLQVLKFKLNESIRFPILAQNPQASLRTHSSMSALGSIVTTVSNLLRVTTNRDIFIQSSLLALRVVRIFLLMVFAEQFPTLSQDAQPVNDGLHPSRDYLRSKQHQEGNASDQNPYFAALVDKGVVIPAHQLKGAVNDCLKVIQLVHHERLGILASPEVQSSLAALVAPDFFQLILALVTNLRINPAPLFSILQTVVSSGKLGFENAATTLSNFYLLAEYVSTVPGNSPSLVREATWAMSVFAMAEPKRVVYQAVRTTFAPFLTHSLASQFYSRSMMRQTYDIKQQAANADTSDETRLLRGPPAFALSSSIQPGLSSKELQQVYRYPSRTTPQGHPQLLLNNSARNQPILLANVPLSESNDDVMANDIVDKSYWVFYSMFEITLAPHLLQSQLYYINHRDTFFDAYDSPNLASQEASDTTQAYHQQQSTYPLNSSPQLVLPSTKLAVDPMIQVVPYMAIHQNLNRILFYFLSSLHWNPTTLWGPGEDDQPTSLHSSAVSWILLYVELFHTYLCKPIELIQVQDATQTIKPTLQNQYTASKHTPAPTDWDSLSFGQAVLTPQQAAAFEGCIISRPDGTESRLQTYKHPSTFHQHAHLPPSIVRQLYYVYTETLLSCIFGFCFTLFEKPLLNDQTAHSVAGENAKQSQSPQLVGISSLHEATVYSPFLPESGTLFDATRPFRDGESNQLEILEDDSYHRHLIDLHTGPPSLLYAFQPQRAPESQYKLHYLSTDECVHPNTHLVATSPAPKPTQTPHHLPNHVIEFQKTGLMPLSLEWSSSCVQHFIELFLDLLLNENAWAIVSQIDFSDDQQPVPKEFVVDYVRRDDPYEWATRQPQFGDEDHYPLFTDYVPSKYQAQIPTLATLAIDPSNPSSLPHSIFNPTITTDEEKTNLQEYYNSHPSHTPTLIFNNASKAERTMGYKAPTRGHLPFFYNLTSSEQDQLYAAFDQATLFDDLLQDLTPTPVLPTASLSSSSLTSTTPVSPFDLDLQAFVDCINFSIPLEQHEVRANRPRTATNKEESSNAPNAVEFTNHQHFLTTMYSPPPSLPSKQPHDPKLLFEVAHALVSQGGRPLNRRHCTILQTLPLQPLVDKQQLEDIFQQENLKSSQANHLIPSNPVTLPPTFTLPAELIIDYIQFNRHKTTLARPQPPNPYLTNLDSTIPPTISAHYQASSQYHPLSHNLLHHQTQMIHIPQLDDRIAQHRNLIHQQLQATLTNAGIAESKGLAYKQQAGSEEFTAKIEAWAAEPSTHQLLLRALAATKLPFPPKTKVKQF